MSTFDFKKIFEFSPLPIYVHQDGFFRMVNPKVAQVTGYTMEELLQLPFEKLIHSEDRTWVMNNARRRQAGEEIPEDYEFRIINRQGEVIYIHGVFSRTEFDGRPAILGQILDITKQKQMMKALKASEEKYRTVIENANEAIFVAQDGILKLINPKVLEITGYSKQALISTPFKRFIHPDDQEKVMQWHLERQKGKKVPVAYPFKVIDKAGNIKWVEINAVPIILEERPATLNFLNDVTGRWQAEEELKLQKAYFQQLFENSPEGIVTLDNTDRIIEANKGFEKLFQYSIEEIRGCYINKLIVPANLSDEASTLSGAVLSGETIQKESVRRRKDGSLVDISILAYPIVFNNKQVGIYAIYSDITKRKQIEEQLRYLSLHDPLTGLYNRTYFEQEMHRLEGGRYAPVGVIVSDVDGLKLINDTLGHKAGDTLLVAAAGVIRESFRGGDMVARIGGDEFAVLLPDSPRPVVEDACRRIQDAIARYNAANPELPLSISTGFAVGSETLTSLGDLFKEADDNMYREKLHRSQGARSAIVQTLIKTLEVRDFITEGHADRLQDLVAALAMAIGLPERNVTDLRLLAQFHDIGHVGIPERILFKTGPFTSEEAFEMRRHCEIGYRIAQSAPDLVPIADWILKHHEWWDGKGYPLGLKGEEIPLECRILAIADAYDAMISDRPYRKALPHGEAIAELKCFAGIKFDPQLVLKFVQVLENL